jgi:hypothetical protein
MAAACCSLCLEAKPKAEFTAAQLKKKEARRCKTCVNGSLGATPAPDGQHTSGDDEGSSDDDSVDERPELRAALEALGVEIANAATSAERRVLAEAEAVELVETLADLDAHVALQDELDALEALKGPARKAAKGRITQIEKALDLLESKHATKQLVSAGPIEAPVGVAFLEFERATRGLAVTVTSCEAYLRHQCVLSHQLAVSKGAKGALPMLLDSSANGRARRKGLGKTGSIADLDKKDASAQVRFADGAAVWYPVAALGIIASQ